MGGPTSVDLLLDYGRDCRESLPLFPDNSVQCVVTSPPYFGLRDYGVGGQIGQEKTPAAYVANLVEVMRAVKRVLRSDGTLWLNLGDTYNSGSSGSIGTPTITGGLRNQRESNRVPRGRIAGFKPKDLFGIPWRVAFALQEDGWYLRSSIIWAKPNPMPENVTDRPTRSHENVFLLTKSPRYFYDAEAIKEPSSESPGGRNARDVWTIVPRPYLGAHFATMPPELALRCIKAGSRPGDLILDPFSGSGTTGVEAIRSGRKYLGLDLNADYLPLAEERLRGVSVERSVLDYL